MSTALISAVVSLAVSLITAASSMWLQRNKAKSDLESQRLAIELEREKFAAERKQLEDQIRLEEQAAGAVRSLLGEDRFKLRSFELLKRRIGGIRDDDELRRLLLRSGALRFQSRTGEEQWGLRERNTDRLDAGE